MNSRLKKFLVTVVVAGIMFALVGCSSRGSNPTPISSTPASDFIARFEINGVISSDIEETLFSTASGYRHTDFLNFIDKMIINDNNKGLMIYINTPGGTVYDSDELYLKIMQYKEETNRPVWVYMGPQACSGGYYIAAAADKIIANRNTWTGSIGVIIQVQNITELMDKLGIKIEGITSGDYKEIGSPYKPMTDSERAVLQSMTDEAFEQFVDIVALGRNMTKEEVLKVADGRIFTAKQALELNLIDEILVYEDMQVKMASELNVSTIYDIPVPESSNSLFSSLLGVGTLGSSETLELLKILENVKPARAMYIRG